MPENTPQKQLAIIKEMIDKTRKDTAESGYFFIFAGFISLIGTLLVGILEHAGQLQGFLIPLLIFITVINGGIAYGIIVKEQRRHAVKTYVKTLFWRTWQICGLSALLIVFLFPALHICTLSNIPVYVSIIMGIALYLSGVILELPFLQLSSLVWFSGAVLSGIFRGNPAFYIMLAVIIFGWIVPGFQLNRRYRARSVQ